MLSAKKKATPDGSEWVTCGNCGHKMMKIILCPRGPLYSGRVVFEVKCSSCKKINNVDIDSLEE